MAEMEVELSVGLSPEGLTERRRKKITEWVTKLKGSLEGKVDRLEIRIVSDREAHDVKNKGDEESAE